MTGIIFIVLGLIYIIYPNIFRRGIWMKTSIAIRTMNPDNYKKYIRILGVILIILGFFLVLKYSI